MARNGLLSHIAISVGHPERSIPFYHALLGSLGFTRVKIDDPAWTGTAPQRATWGLRYGDGARFDIEVRPARPESRDRRYDRS
jgi:catechol 2,3-dioxygenase-like lactoylglutathione lyase family enzyme